MKLCIDFNSDEAFYIQLINQIILGIAMEQFQEGDSLPSVRQMADLVGINMHTVNKAKHIAPRGLHQTGSAERCRHLYRYGQTSCTGGYETRTFGLSGTRDL